MSMHFLSSRQRRGEMSIPEKLWAVSWSLVALVTLIASYGFLMLYSAANGSLDPWADRQMARYGMGLLFMLTLAMVDVRQLLRYSYVCYGIALVLLVAVELKGTVGMGAQRWIDLGFIQLQPSEVMKIALVLALARYFHGLPPDSVRRLSSLPIPMSLALAPAALVLKQPDLGTAMMLLFGAVGIAFAAGVRKSVFILLFGSGIAIIPIAWEFLRDYQKNRVLIFLNPEKDPLGAGYHITQSKIALGSGGLFGKGFMQGTQSHLNFLPERQTDFIFTMLSEELGMIGGLVLLGLYILVLVYGYVIALRCRHQFGKLLAIGVTTTFFLYVFINTAMVMGLIPVVGVPLPLISYGGTAMLTLMIGFGILMSVHVHRDVVLGRHGGDE